MLRLKYYGKIVRMGEDRLVKQVYVESRKRLEEGKQSKWCADTKAILLPNIGMGEEHKQWNRQVWKAVNQKNNSGKNI